MGGTQTEQRTSALAALYGAGLVVCVLILSLSRWPNVNRAGIAVTAVAALVTTVLLFLLRRHVRPWMHHATLAMGTAILGLGIVMGGGGAASATITTMYVWGAIYGFMFFSGWAAALHLCWAAVTATAGLVVIGEAAHAPAQVSSVILIAAVSGGIVGWLVQQIRVLAGSDQLTGLANRRTLDAALQAALCNAARRHQPLAALALDLDGFKALNDQQGHAAGDEALQATAAAWREQLRIPDTLARIGGDEFVALLPGCDEAAAHEIAQRLVAATPKPVAASAGLAVWDSSETGEALLVRADLALYRAKQTGSGQILTCAWQSPSDEPPFGRHPTARTAIPPDDLPATREPDVAVVTGGHRTDGS